MRESASSSSSRRCTSTSVGSTCRNCTAGTRRYRALRGRYGAAPTPVDSRGVAVADVARAAALSVEQLPYERFSTVVLSACCVASAVTVVQRQSMGVTGHSPHSFFVNIGYALKLRGEVCDQLCSRGGWLSSRRPRGVHADVALPPGWLGVIHP